MTLEVYKACCCSLSNELLVKLSVARYEWNVHKRSVLRNNSALEELALVKIIIEYLSLFLVVSLHSLKTAHFLYPLEYLAADVDAIARRCIVKRVSVSLSFPLEHCRCSLENIVSDKIFSDDSNNNAGRTNVFLNATVNNAVLCYVNRLRQEAGRNVCNKCVTLCVRQSLVLCTIDSIVFADINIVSVLWDIQI